MKPVAFFLFIGAVLNVHSLVAQDDVLNIIIVAGQSNAMNWHADAQLLESSILDNDIPFYYTIGLPPDRGFDVPFNSTSDSLWATLSFQTQIPYIRYNAIFFGPEVTLARDLSSHIPGVAVFKSAYGGSELASDWRKGAQTGNQLYAYMMGQFDHATALLEASGVRYEVVGFFWIQGESDAADNASANAYDTNLRNLIQNIRTDVGNPDLKVVLGRISSELPSLYIHKETVRMAQMMVADDDPLVAWVDIDDQLLDTDSVHLLADGVRTLGQRMAVAWLNLMETSIEEAAGNGLQEIDLHNVPNPFNPTTSIRFTLSKPEFVTVRIYDMLGRELVILTQAMYSSGSHSVPFHAESYATGVYLYDVQIGTGRVLKRMTLMK